MRAASAGKGVARSLDFAYTTYAVRIRDPVAICTRLRAEAMYFPQCTDVATWLTSTISNVELAG